MKQITIPVGGMTRASCIHRVERGLRKVPGVEAASVNLATEQATISFDPQQTQPPALIDAVQNSGYSVPLTWRRSTRRLNTCQARQASTRSKQQWKKRATA